MTTSDNYCCSNAHSCVETFIYTENVENIYSLTVLHCFTFIYYYKTIHTFDLLMITFIFLLMATSHMPSLVTVLVFVVCRNALYCFQLVSLCVYGIMAKCDPGDIYCSGNYNRSSFEYLARCLCPSVLLSVEGFYSCDTLTTVQDAVMKLYRCGVVEIKMTVKFKDGCGPSKRA